MRPSLRSVAIALLVLAPVGGAGAAKPKLAERVVTIEIGGSKLIRLGESISRVSNAAPEIADVAPFPPDQVLLTGKRLGQTMATLWTSDEVITLTVIVGYPVEAITSALKQAIPDGRNLRASSAGTALVLSGEVGDAADAERSAEIARGFVATGTAITGVGAGPQQAPPSVVNLIGVTRDQQVQIEVSFAEVSRSALKQIGLNFWHKGSGVAGGLLTPATGPSGLAPVLSPDPNLAGQLENGIGMPVIQTPLGGAFGLLLALGSDQEFPFTTALSVLASNGFSRTLAEPTLVALSGQEASFLAGGEFPLPLPQALGQVVVEFKKFGIQLKFVPTVVRDTIQLKLAATVSDLDFSLGIKLASVTVPGLTERQSATTVRLRDGQSFAIAGLLSDKVRSNVDKVPGLGDLPVLGALFRSTSYRREETELLVVVTARLVRPQNERPALPGEGVQADPSDLELFLFGTQESKEGGALPRRRTRPTGVPAPAGPVGFKRG
ncbi:MAG TPA: type II and III secretion system protein family protein [Polyangia bacterium]|nr:type II and III secretion system protein family protein [Polyangia bacterium]